jgi:hypothetical protein
MRCVQLVLSASVVGICLLIARPTRAEPPSCRISSGITRLPDLPEASGLAASRRTAGVLWSHNDSGDPFIFALTLAGAVKGRVRVTGAQVWDWEDISVGACPQGTCLYIADIGDNDRNRRSVTVYRTPEPAPVDIATEPVEMLRATYPDGPHDAEALVVLPDGELFIITKGNSDPAALYRFTSPFRNGATVSLERVTPLLPSKTYGHESADARNMRITDAEASPDGRWVVLRTPRFIMFYDAREFASGTIREIYRFDVSAAHEPQGEGVALSAEGDVWLVGEGGGKSSPGTFLRLSCTLR